MSRYFRYFPTTTYMNKKVTDITRRVRIIETIEKDPYGFLPYTVKDGDRPEDVARYYYGDANKVWIVYLANGIVDPYTQWPLSNTDLDKTIRAKYKRDPKSFVQSNVNIASNRITIKDHGFKTTDPVIYTKTGTAVSPLVDGTTYYVIRVNDNVIRLATSATNAKNGTGIDITTTGGNNAVHALTLDVDVYLMSTTVISNIITARNNEDPTIYASVDTYLAYPANWTPLRAYDYEVEQNENRRVIWLVNKAYANQLESDLKKVLNE